MPTLPRLSVGCRAVGEAGGHCSLRAVALVAGQWERLVGVAEVLWAGYLLHFVPYLSADRTMFVYSYIPALVFQILLTAFLVEHVHVLLP